MSVVHPQLYASHAGDGKACIHTFNIPLSVIEEQHRALHARRGSIYSQAGSDSDADSASSQDTTLTEPDLDSPLSFTFSARTGPSPFAQSNLANDATERVKAELRQLEAQQIRRFSADDAGRDATAAVSASHQRLHATQQAYLTHSAFQAFPPRRCGAFIGNRIPCSIARPNVPHLQATSEYGRSPWSQGQSQDRAQAYAPHCPIGNHRSALSRVDDLAQTQSLRHMPPKGLTTRPQGPHPLSFSQAQPQQPQAQAPPPSSHPRRTAPGQSWTAPSLRREDDRRRLMVEQLVETASQLVATLWPSSELISPESQPSANSVICLRQFVRETLRRSRTSYNSLQLALFYLVKLRVQGVLASCPPGEDKKSSGKSVQLAMQCGRRMMLTALMLAAKYLQDRNFSARAWHKISGLPVSEITANEIGVLQALNWELHVGEKEFNNWSIIVHKSTELVTSQRSSRDLWLKVSRLYHDGQSIEAIAKLVRPPPPQLMIPSLPATDPSSTGMLMTSPLGLVGLCRSAVDLTSPTDASTAPFATPVSLASAMSTPASQFCGSFSDMFGSRQLPPPAPGLATTLTTPSFTPRSSQSHTSSPAASAGLRPTHNPHPQQSSQRSQALLGMGWMASPKSIGDVSPTSSEGPLASSALSFDFPTTFDAASLAPQAAGTKRRATEDATDSTESSNRESAVKAAKICIR